LVTITLRPEPVEYQVFRVVDEGREEEVFCVVEPKTRSFTLEGGVLTGNCWGVTLRSIDDWCWVMNQLMLGGGVGVGLGSLGLLGKVSAGSGSSRMAVWCRHDHPNVEDVGPNDKEFLNGQTPVHQIPDSREGWVESLRLVLQAAFEGRDIIVDLSDIRPRGEPIRTFGGVACGPGPLSMLLRFSWDIVRGAVGRGLTSVECLDITNLIGFCVKSGNVRRSALIVLGDAEDRPFRDAKKDFEAVKSHRHTSNNSLLFYTDKQIAEFDWHGMVEDNILYGEPGLLNLALIRKTDPGATVINPCFSGDTKIAVADGRNSVSIRQLAEEGEDVPVYSLNKETGKIEIKMGRNPRITGYNQKLVRVWLDDGSHLDTTPNHGFLLRDGTPVEAKDLQPGDSLPRFKKALEKVKKGGKDYYRIYCNTRHPDRDKIFEHRLIACFQDPDGWDRVYSVCAENGFANTGGLVVHHKDYDQLNNAPDNLQIMTFRDHAKLHGEKDNSGEANGRWSGLTCGELKDHGLTLTRKLGRRFSKKDWLEYASAQGIPQAFSGYRSWKSVVELAKQCASELGLEHVDTDPRVIKTLCSMLEQGYEAFIKDSKVFVVKSCEGCSASFEVEHSYRERSFCSEACGNAYINSDAKVKAKRLQAMDTHYGSKQVATKVEQARVCSDLAFRLGRHPNRKEWSLACKGEGVPSRIGPTLKHGFKKFSEVLEAASDYNHKVARVEELEGEHTVYNLTVDENHTVSVITKEHKNLDKFWFSGVSVRQCGEIPLHNREACNLAEAFPAQFDGSTDPGTVFRLLTRYCLRQRLTPLLDEESDEVRRKNMRLGVGLGGICDFDWVGPQLARWFEVCRLEANSYADELGVARPNAVTTTKPSGTISLLNSSSPGIHAPFAPYYIRRARLAVNEPMTRALQEAGVAWEYDVYDQTGHTLVFSFPTKAVHTRVTVQTETIDDQFERQALIQEWWADNSVSATLSFNPETERERTAELLAKYVPRFKSTSLLAKAHGYAQAPYEEISESQFQEMFSGIKHDHPLVNDGGDVEIEECANGVCPVR
jgi:hypothetical protein